MDDHLFPNLQSGQPEDIRRFILDETVLHHPPLCPELRLHLVTDACALWRANSADLDQIGLSAPYWAFCWPGGQCLARFLLDHPDVVRGRSVLDFGAGSGVGGIAAALAGASRVVASDIDPIAMEAILLNAKENQVVIEVTTADLVGNEVIADVLLIGDMFYDVALALRLWTWLADFVDRGGKVLIGDPYRAALPKEQLRLLATYHAPTDVDVHGEYRKAASVFGMVTGPISKK